MRPHLSTGVVNSEANGVLSRSPFLCLYPIGYSLCLFLFLFSSRFIVLGFYTKTFDLFEGDVLVQGES